MTFLSRVFISATLAFVYLCVSQVSAQLAFFDFEGVAVDGVEDGSLSSLVLSDSGLSLTITRTSGVNFDVINDDAFGFPNGYPSPGWGNQALSPFFAPNIPDEFNVNFSSSVTLFGIQMGDYGGDVDDLFLNAWSGLNGTGSLIDSDFDVFTGDFNMTGAGDGPANLVVAGAGIQSVTFRGAGATLPHSVYYDNFRVAFVPEPSTLCTLGLVVFACSMRRKRKN